MREIINDEWKNWIIKAWERDESIEFMSWWSDISIYKIREIINDHIKKSEKQ